MKKLIFSGFILSLTLLASCDKKNDAEVKKADSTNLNEKEVGKKDSSDLSKNIANVTEKLPSPVDFISHIDQTKLTYKAKFLNNMDNAENYLGTSQKTALNLGVYLVDLGYNSLYLKSQEGLKYLKSVKKLSDQLNILDDQTKRMLARFESNLENRDSLLTIAREGYFTIDNYLHKNERKDASTYILVGSWVEGLYLGTSLVKENPNFATDEKYKPILWRIGGQKESLNNLISLLKEFDKNDHKDLITKLEELKKIYESVKIEQGEADSEELLDIAEVQNSDELSEKVMMKTLKKVEISKENVEKIAEKIAEIRKMITEK